MPQGRRHLPIRALATIDPNLIPFGGGAWVLQEGNDLWYVKNNGADGDDWSQNNVITGGAGA